MERDESDVRDTKTNRPVIEIVKPFKFQASRSACYTVCTHNILHELAARHNAQNIRLSEARLNQITKFKEPIGPKLEIVVHNLNQELSRYGYYANEQNNATYDRLLKVLGDQSCSYPLVGLAYSYLRDEMDLFKDSEIQDPPDHVVTLLSLDDRNVTFHDPYGVFASKHTGNLSSHGIFSLTTPKFLDEYWGKALFSKWLFYVEKRGLKREGLDRFMGGE